MYSNGYFSGKALPAVIILLLLFVANLIWKAFYNLVLHPLSSVPGPLPAKIFASYLSPALIRGDRAQTLLRLHQQYGSVVRVGPNEVSVSDWKSYREIYGVKASSKEESFYAAATFLGHENVFSMRNKAQHSARRKMQSTPYSQQAVNENQFLIAEKADTAVRRIISSAYTSPTRQTADIFEVCGLFSFEVICKCGFDRDFGDSADGDSQIMLRAMDGSAALLPIDAVFPFLKKLGIGKYVPGGIGHAFKSFEIWEQKTREMVLAFQQQNENFDTKQAIMASPILMNNDEFLGRKLTQDEAVEEAMGLTFAGSGTTSTTLVYLIYALSRLEAQGYQERLRSELQLAGEDLNAVKDLPYLNAVIKETMRLYPTIISTLPRVLDIELTVGDGEYRLPAGTKIGMQNFVHHRDPQVFPAPDQFLPERWISESTKEMASALTPFSLGPRNCIGQNLARAELYLAVSKIFRKLKLTVNPAMKELDMEMEDRFNIAPKGRRLLVDIEVLD